MIYIILISILIILDQVSKQIVVNRFSLGETFPIVEEFFHLTYVRNKGVAFGLFQNKVQIISVFTILAVIGIAIYSLKYLKKSDKIEKIAYAFIFSGAIGNMLDRLFRGYVVDMVDFRGIWIYIFNLADVWINVGLFLIIIDYFIRRNKE